MTKHRFNRVVLNVGAHGTAERPEPDLPLMTIDGTPIDNIQRLVVTAGVGEFTCIQIIMNCEVGGFVGQENIGQAIRDIGKDK